MYCKILTIYKTIFINLQTIYRPTNSGLDPESWVHVIHSFSTSQICCVVDSPGSEVCGFLTMTYVFESSATVGNLICKFPKVSIITNMS